MPFSLLPSCELSFHGYDISKSLWHTVALGIDLLFLERILSLQYNLLDYFVYIVPRFA